MAKQTFTTGQVLTAAQMTSLQQTAMLGGDATAKTASYVLVAADAGTVVTMNAAGATTITVNTGLFAAGDTVTIVNLGAGTTTITAGTATVTTSGSLALSQNEGGILRFTSASAAIFLQFNVPPASSGGMTSIATGTLSGSSVVLSSIPATYNQLFLEIKDGYPTANGYAIQVTITGENANYLGSYLQNSGGTTTTATSHTDSITKDAQAALNNADNNNYLGVTFLNYASTSVRKLMQCYGSYYTNGSVNRTVLVNTAINYSSAISSLTIGLEGGSATTFAGGTYVLWGVK